MIQNTVKSQLHSPAAHLDAANKEPDQQPEGSHHTDRPTSGPPEQDQTVPANHKPTQQHL